MLLTFTPADFFFQSFSAFSDNNIKLQTGRSDQGNCEMSFAQGNATLSQLELMKLHQNPP